MVFSPNAQRAERALNPGQIRIPKSPNPDLRSNLSFSNLNVIKSVQNTTQYSAPKTVIDFPFYVVSDTTLKAEHAKKSLVAVPGKGIA